MSSLRGRAAAADRQRAKALRGDLDAIVLTALKREPENRYQSAATLADDIERIWQASRSLLSLTAALTGCASSSIATALLWQPAARSSLRSASASALHCGKRTWRAIRRNAPPH